MLSKQAKIQWKTKISEKICGCHCFLKLKARSLK